MWTVPKGNKVTNEQLGQRGELIRNATGDATSPRKPSSLPLDASFYSRSLWSGHVMSFIFNGFTRKLMDILQEEKVSSKFRLINLSSLHYLKHCWIPRFCWKPKCGWKSKAIIALEWEGVFFLFKRSLIVHSWPCAFTDTCLYWWWWVVKISIPKRVLSVLLFYSD